jgi:low temperature requirement protein LtrA
VVAILLDYGGPFFFGTEGWKLMPAHFAERHGLIVIIALGESIVAIGVGAQAHLTLGITAAAVLGLAVAAALWWIYFDVVAPLAARRLARASVGREQNTMARDAFSYLHFPLVAGVVLVALGLKKTLADVDTSLHYVPAFALLGGTAVYLFAHVAIRLRNVHTLNQRRLVLGFALLALVPAATAVPALATLGFLTLVLAALIAYETRLYGEARDRVRHGAPAEAPPG